MILLITYFFRQYLIDCIIHAFPDEYHIYTLKDLIELITEKVEPKVDNKLILIHVMER